MPGTEICGKIWIPTLFGRHMMMLPAYLLACQFGGPFCLQSKFDTLTSTLRSNQLKLDTRKRSWKVKATHPLSTDWTLQIWGYHPIYLKAWKWILYCDFNTCTLTHTYTKSDCPAHILMIHSCLILCLTLYKHTNTHIPNLTVLLIF